MIVVRYRLDEHNMLYYKLKRMQKDLKELMSCIEDKNEELDGNEEDEREEDEREEYRYNEPKMRRHSSSTGGRYGYRMR